jgi:hypothetical protein
MNEEKKFKLVFAPGCFDDFEGTQEELDDLITEINRQLDTGEFFENATELSDEVFDDLPESEKAKIDRFFENDLVSRTLH